MTFLGGNLLAYNFKGRIKCSQNRVDFMIERISVVFIFQMVNRRMDLVEISKAWVQFDKQRSIERSTVMYGVKQRILQRDQHFKFKSNRYLLSVSSSYSFKS